MADLDTQEVKSPESARIFFSFFNTQSRSRTHELGFAHFDVCALSHRELGHLCVILMYMLRPELECRFKPEKCDPQLNYLSIRLL